jgi:hypothetical protein
MDEPLSAVPVTSEPTLPELMSRLARRVSFVVALWICAVSVLGLVAILLFTPARWRLATACVAGASFGAWTMADHERRDWSDGLPTAPAHSFRWRVVQSISGATGVASLFVLLLAFLSSTLGTWIS